MWFALLSLTRGTTHAWTEAFTSLDEQRIRVYGEVAINTGRHSMHEIMDGQPTVRPLRFSFTYRRQDGRWLIVDHHSSALPVAP